MFEINACRGLINLLPSPAGGPNEFLFKVLLMDAKGFHLFLKPSILLFTNRE
jgi:hypothetical protein